MISAMPSVLSANPARMIVAGRRPPDLRPARIATANMVSESGAIDRPVCRASYSSLICRKIGSAIIAPPSVMFCSICPEIPILKCGSRNRSGIEQRHLPLAMAPHEPAGERPQRERADRDQQHDVVAALLPHQDAQHHAAHPHDGQARADRVDLPRSRVRDVLEEPDLRQHDRDDDGLEQEADAPGQVGGDEPSEQRPDRGGDRRRRSDERIGLLLCRSLEVAMDQGLHRRQQERGAEAADDRPEDDDRRQALGERHRQRADRIRQQTQHVRPLASERGRRPCC